MEMTGGLVMMSYLPDTIQTFSSQSRKTVSTLLQNIKIDKTQISGLVENLRDLDLQVNYTPALALLYSPMNLEGVVEFFRDSSLRVGDFFSAASSISNVLSSTVSIFSSEIEKLEKDIEYLESFINNYQFISGEDDLFNFNFVENFNNDLNSNKMESKMITLFDRDNIQFSSDGNYAIDSVLSKMSIYNGATFINPLLGGNAQISEYTNNYSDFATTDTGFISCLNEVPTQTWTVTAKSPYVLTSQLSELSKVINYDYSYIRGAQCKVVMTLTNPQEMDFIRITPNDSNGFQLLQVVLNKTDTTLSASSGNNQTAYVDFPVLNAPLNVKKTTDVLFSKCTVDKVTFFFNQSKYIRSENVPSLHESNAKFIYDLVKNIRDAKSKQPSKLQDIVYHYFGKYSNILNIRKNTKMYTDIYSYRYPSGNYINKSGAYGEMVEMKNYQIQDKLSDNISKSNNNIISNIVHSIVEHSIDSRNNLFNNTIYKGGNSSAYRSNASSINTDGIIPLKKDQESNDIMFQREDAPMPGLTVDRVTNYLNSMETSDSYEYSFSLRNISFGVLSKNKSQKACFISSKIETMGSPLAVKGIVNIINERKNLNFNNYDLREPGSVELSICLKEDINSENDWIPLVHSFNGEIDSEVLFFDGTNATLRFTPKPTSIKVYKDGALQNPNNWFYDPIRNNVKYNLPVDSSSIYVASYSLDSSDYNQFILDANKVLDGKTITRSYSSSGNQGQKFLGTGPGNKVKLDYIPYVEDKFNNAVYNNNYGSVNITNNIGYSPVTVTLEDGTVAINLTNYIKNDYQKANFYSTSDCLFYQSGKELIFNKPISQNLTVGYNYIPDILRFRVIIRENIQNQYNGISLDNVILKCKTKNLDPFSEKLLRLN